MRFYDYLRASESSDFHPELKNQIAALPRNIEDFPHLVIHGPSGSGKYTQMLKMISALSASGLKHEHRITAITDKQRYTYRSSDVHFEVDMSLLSCNSRTLWTEIVSQITNIAEISASRCCIVACLNFHEIHQELLDIFYSYLQRGITDGSCSLKFILVSESISFIPTRLLSRCQIFSVGLPDNSKDPSARHPPSLREYEMFQRKTSSIVFEHAVESPKTESSGVSRKNASLKNTGPRKKTVDGGARTAKKAMTPGTNEKPIELHNTVEEKPEVLRIIDVVCANIIRGIAKGIPLPAFRDILYDISIYGLDASECVWIVLGEFIENGVMRDDGAIERIIDRLPRFFRYRNNNYREIFHLECIFFAIWTEVSTSISALALPKNK